MKLFNIDWEVFLDHALVWEELAPRTRAVLLELKPNVGVDNDLFGGDLEMLLKKRVLQSYVKKDSVRLHEDFQDTSKALRAMDRVPIELSPTRETLQEYLIGNFTSEEREVLAGENDLYGRRKDLALLAHLASASHVRGFLEADDPRAWESRRLPEEYHCAQLQNDSDPLLTGPHAVGDLRALLEGLGTREDPVLFRDLRTLLARRSKARIATAVHAAIRYALAFGVIDPDTLCPILTLWPPVAQHWNRRATPFPAAIDPASLEQTFDVPFGCEDVVQLLVVASEPVRLRTTDHSIFVKAQREIEASLLPLPPQLTGSADVEWPPAQRVRDARALAVARGLLVEAGTRGGTLRLELTDPGRDWLALPPHERLALLLDPMRAPASPAREDEGDATSADAGDGGFAYRPWYLAPVEAGGFLPAIHLDLGPTVDAARVIARAMRLLDGHGALPRAAFLRHLTESTSPFRDPAVLDHVRRLHPWHPPTQEELEDEWGGALAHFLWLRLVCFGGVRTGWTANHVTTVELTDIGRYMLRLRDDLPRAEDGSPAHPVRVQPDFEVVFLAPSPPLEAAFVRIAERRGTGVGVLFRITRPSIHAAARAGLSLDEVLATLRDSSSTALPRNVEHEVRAWFAECRRLPLEPTLVLRCPDEDTAARILSAAGRRVELVNPTTLLLLDPAKRAEVVRLCKKAGLFLEGGEPEKPEKKARRRTRRYRRW